LRAALDREEQTLLELRVEKEMGWTEIAEILKIPLGTVKSRISRGIAQLQRLIEPQPKRSLRERHARE
jgi:DNA-directed RNA polymerase specialized sigma24 family protein